MSVMVHPIAFLYLLNSDIRASTCDLIRSVATITSKVFFSPRKTYHKCPGNFFNSSTGGFSVDGFAGGVGLFFKSKSSFFRAYEY